MDENLRVVPLTHLTLPRELWANYSYSLKGAVTETETEPRDGQENNDDELERTRTRKWKTPLRIGTWNVRSLYGTGNAMTVDTQIHKYNMDIVAVQETRWPGQGETRINDYTLLYSGRDDDAHRQGVGFYISNNL